jgi:glycosyltransferase involved in cell wall biosynthesis
MVASLTYGDAISNEALHIQSILRNRGYASEIFAESADSAMAGHAKRLRDYEEVSDPSNVLIVHFSIGSSLSTFTQKLKDKILLIYHNITPPEWFAPYAPRVAKQCHRGREELFEFAERADLILGVSNYNRNELREMGFENAEVLPLLSSYEPLTDPPHPPVLKMFDDDKTNFLFVGRVTPNKRFEDLLKVFATYQKHIERRCRLLLVGDWLPIENYHLALVQMFHKLQLRDVVFTGHVSTAELVAYYEVADLFLCMSEHEGFCAPLLEAFHLEIPVIAYDAGAVSETLGGGGILVHQKNYEEIAELAYMVTHDDGFREAIIKGQNRVLEDYASRDHEELLMRYVKQVAEVG